MTTFHLDKFLSGHVFAFVLVFSRVGSILMLFPGIGESYVSTRIRLMLAFMVSFLIMGPLLPRIPQPPESISALTLMVGYEVVIGLFFGTMLRLIMSTLESAGSVIALQTGLSNATVLNPTMAAQSPLVSAFLTTAGTVLIFVTGLDAVLLRSLAGIYDLFPIGGQMIPGDMAQTIIQMTNRSFVLGTELAMPFLIIGLLMYIALGVIQKLLPQVQLFLVVLPVQIWGGLALLSITMAGIMTYWLRYFDASVGTIFGR